MKDWKLALIVFSIVSPAAAILIIRTIIPPIGVNVNLSVDRDNPRGVNVSSHRVCTLRTCFTFNVFGPHTITH